jgi:hypothetical protein
MKGTLSQETITDLDTIHVSLFRVNPGGHPPLGLSCSRIVHLPEFGEMLSGFATAPHVAAASPGCWQ